MDQHTSSTVPDRTITSAGIDYLTLTTVSRETKLRMMRYYNGIVVDDHRLGYEAKPGGAFGFYGSRTRHALYAHKDDRSMLQVTGKAAQRSVILVAPGDNCTRLDVQFTIYVGEENVQRYLSDQASRAAAPRVIRGKRPDVTQVLKNGSCQTVYIGSRKSEIFVRLYDKYAESKDDCFRGCVRLECEFKGATSKALWAYMAREGVGTMWLLRILLQVLEERGVDIAGIDIDRQDVKRPKPSPSKEERTIGWWASQVAPSVARISSERGWYTAFRVLFDKALTEWDKTAIMNALSVSWGD